MYRIIKKKLGYYFTLVINLVLAEVARIKFGLLKDFSGNFFSISIDFR